MRALLIAGVVLASGGLAGAAPVHERFGAATVDFSAGTVIVAGSAAADLHAPNAAVARVRAERSARLIAARRLLAAMAAVPAARLGCKWSAEGSHEAAVEAAALAAQTDSIEWSSDGSVSLVLRIALAELVAAPATDGGVASGGGPAAIRVDAAAAPRWFSESDGHCAAAPRFVEDAAAVRKAGAAPARSR